MVTDFVYIPNIDSPRYKTPKNKLIKTSKSWVLGVTVAVVTEANDRKMPKLTYFEAISEGFAK